MSESVSPPQNVSLEEEFKRNPQLKMSDLEMLMEWMNKQPHLPKIEIMYLVYFLHSNYYRMEPTKRTIESFFTVRSHMPDVFCHRDPVGWKGLRKAFTVVACAPLKQRTKEGYVMTMGKLLDPNPNAFDHFESAKYLFMVCETQQIVQGTSSGLVVVLDATNFSFGHVARINLLMMKKLFFYVQEAAPVRLKALHILNAIPAATALMNMARPFIKKELLSLIHFHSDMETVKEFLPIEALPNEYEGGKGGPFEEIIAENIRLLEDFREWFQYDERAGRVDESLRVGEFQVEEDLFGMDGSFKKLELD